MEEVCHKEIQPLASHPNTLNMLLRLFNRPDGLPSQRAELYRLGCETLAAERNPFRQESHHTGKMSERQRMTVAGRIAAQMVFGHYATIWRGDSWDAEMADLFESNIVGNTERIDGLDFSVDALALKETIECALFSGRGEKRIGFAHQSYAEFLAAWYLHSHGLETQRALALLCHPVDGRIPPQYTEAAIWLAALNEDFFAALVETEPLLLLRTDLSDTTDKQKFQLTEKLLCSYASRTEFDMDWGLRKHYRKLTHPSLGTQLSPYIVDKEVSLVSRRAAMEIATACNVRELAGGLITIALNHEEEYQQRLNAVNATADLADADQLSDLRSLVFEECSEDLGGSLKAALIPSLWPLHVSTKEIFELLSQPQSVRYLGWLRYSPDKFVQRFTDDDLVTALQWVVAFGKNRQEYESDLLKNDIMEEAWKRCNVSHVLNAFVHAAWACINRYESLFNRKGRQKKDSIEEDESKRRTAIIALLEVSSASKNKHDPESLMIGENAIILPQDANWLLDFYQTNTNLAMSMQLAKCIRFFVRWESEPTWLDMVITVACADALNIESPLADEIIPLLEPIYLDSDMANRLKSQHDRQAKWKTERPKLLAPSPLVRVGQALQKFESGKNDAWMSLWQELSLPDDATGYQFDFNGITKYPGWQQAGASERTRIVHCAKAWVMKVPLAQEDMFRTDNSISYRHIATYLALLLLAEESQQSLENVSENWLQLAEVIVAYDRDNEPEPRRTLLRHAYSNAPTSVIEAYRRLLERDISTPHSLHRIEELTAIWDQHIADLLHDFLKNPGLALNHISNFLDLLLRNGDDDAYEYARITLTSRPFIGPPNIPLMLVAAQSLISHQICKGWPVVWENVLGDSVFGENLMLRLAHYSGRDGGLLPDLSEKQISELYFWLEEHFPAVNDVRYPSGQAHSITARDEVGRLRNHCPQYLSDLGTQVATDALSAISDRFPDNDWLKYLLTEAKQAFRKSTLRALTPTELITYLHRKDARLARNSAELIEAVLVSLQRFQNKLRGQTPLAPFLWNLTDNGKSGRPKSEDRLTDFIKHHLESDLPTFVIDREVQIRNLCEHGIGERTDLKIETKSPEGYSISVIIESKGCWNNELLTSMESQLFERYLKLSDGACGIYLVGWFHCDRWMDRGNFAFTGTKEALVDILNAQAQSLSSDKCNLSAFVLDVSY